MTIHRVVFDTSTLVSAALRPDSVPYQALHRALRFCDVYASKETVDELKKVLARGKFQQYLPDDVRQQFVQMMENNLRLLAVRGWTALALAPTCRDALDNKSLALAYEAEADAIVSSNEDLMVLHPWNEVRILRPADLMNEVAYSGEVG
ncbi:MAG: putative toxin-antitoxin system toxin component, PIN family [Acidobacteriaceae bacterium]